MTHEVPAEAVESVRAVHSTDGLTARPMAGIATLGFTNEGIENYVFRRTACLGASCAAAKRWSEIYHWNENHEVRCSLFSQSTHRRAGRIGFGSVTGGNGQIGYRNGALRQRQRSAGRVRVGLCRCPL